MELIFAAALCSVAVSIILKICRDRGLVPMQMIAWNYAMASVLTYLWFKPDLVHVSVEHTPWWLITVLGILLPAIFFCLSKSLQSAGILKTEISQRLSVVLSLLAAYFIFHEAFNQLKILGIIMGVCAVFCILDSHKSKQLNHGAKPMAFISLLAVWVGYALIDVLLKYTTGLGLQFSVTLNLMFIFAFVLSMLYIIVKYKSMGTWQNIGAGLLLGVLNFANIALYVKAHMLLKDSPAVVFAGMNVLVVMLGVLSGLFIFKERVKPIVALGLALGLSSVLCLAYAM